MYSEPKKGCWQFGKGAKGLDGHAKDGKYR